MNYYIIENRIIAFANELDSTLYTYEKLNAEQKAFYELHNCSLPEVLSLTLNTYYVPTLDDLKAQKIQYFSNLSFEKRALKLPEYKLVNTGLGIYSEQEAAEIKQTVIDFRTEFYRLKALVEAATTIEELNAITDNYESL